MDGIRRNWRKFSWSNRWKLLLIFPGHCFPLKIKLFGKAMWMVFSLLKVALLLLIPKTPMSRVNFGKWNYMKDLNYLFGGFWQVFSFPGRLLLTGLVMERINVPSAEQRWRLIFTCSRNATGCVLLLLQVSGVSIWTIWRPQTIKTCWKCVFLHREVWQLLDWKMSLLVLSCPLCGTAFEITEIVLFIRVNQIFKLLLDTLSCLLWNFHIYLGLMLRLPSHNLLGCCPPQRVGWS